MPLYSIICSPQYTINIHIPHSVFYKTGREQEVTVVFTFDGIGDIDYGLIIISTDNRNFITNSFYLENGIQSYNHTTGKMFFKQLEIFDNRNINRQLYDSWGIIVAPPKLDTIEYHLIKGYFKLDIEATNIGKHYITIQLFIKNLGENYIFYKEYEYYVYNWIDQYYPYISPFISGGIIVIVLERLINWVRNKHIKRNKFPSEIIV